MTPPEPDPALLPRCEGLNGTGLKIVPAYTEAGQFCEAQCVTVTDGVRAAVYVPADYRERRIEELRQDAEDRQRVRGTKRLALHRLVEALSDHAVPEAEAALQGLVPSHAQTPQDEAVLREYLGGPPAPPEPNARPLRATLQVAVASWLVCVAAAGVGLFTEYKNGPGCVAMLGGLYCYAATAKWVANVKHNTRLKWTLERIRMCLAYDGDPGPFPGPGQK